MQPLPVRKKKMKQFDLLRTLSKNFAWRRCTQALHRKSHKRKYPSRRARAMLLYHPFNKKSRRLMFPRS
jgi:hypothetical protein